MITQQQEHDILLNSKLCKPVTQLANNPIWMEYIIVKDDLPDWVAGFWTLLHNNGINNYCVKLIVFVSGYGIIDVDFVYVGACTHIFCCR